MHSAEDSAAIAIRILQRREGERAAEAAEREENAQLEVALAESQNEVASLRNYVAALEARLNGIYAEMAQPTMQLRPRGLGRRFVRFMAVALLGAVGVLLFQVTTPLGGRLTDSLHHRSLGGLAAQVSQAFRRQFGSAKTDAPAVAQPTPAPVAVQPAPAVVQPAPVVVEPAPVVVQQPEPPKLAPLPPPAAPAVAPARSESRRRAPSAPSKHAQPRKEPQHSAVQEALIPACSDSDPLCGISKRPH